MPNKSQLLRKAAENNDLEKLQSLIAQGVDLDAPLSEGYIPIVGAFVRGDGDVIEYRALHFAAKYDRCEAAELLIKNGANINIGNVLDNSPLHIAVYYRKHKVAELLLMMGADINHINKHCWTPTASYASTPLHYAVEYADVAMVDLLLRHAPRLDIKDANGLTVEELAIKLNKAEALKLIQKKLQEQKQARAADFKAKWQDWVVRNIQFTTLYRDLQILDPIHYQRYQELYEYYADAYQYLLDSNVSKNPYTSADALEQDVTVALKRSEKINKAYRYFQQKQTQLTKQAEFIVEQLRLTPEQRNSNERLQQAVKLFANRENAEAIIYAHTTGLENRQERINQELIGLELALANLLKQQGFYEEVIKRASDCQKFDIYASEFKTVIQEFNELYTELKSQYLAKTSEKTTNAYQINLDNLLITRKDQMKRDELASLPIHIQSPVRVEQAPEVINEATPVHTAAVASNASTFFYNNKVTAEPVEEAIFETEPEAVKQSSSAQEEPDETVDLFDKLLNRYKI